MLKRFRRYYYEVSYAGRKAGAPEPVKGKVVVEAADLDREFPTKEGPITPEEQDEQRKAVETYFLAHPPADVDQVDEHAIERKDEFDEHFGVISTATKLICRWTSLQIFTLDAKQEDVFKIVHHQLLTVSMKWGEWKTLFGPPFQNVEVLQQTAPTIFSVIRESLMHEVMLSIRRLFDPSGRQQENASFYWLAEKLAPGKQRDEFEERLRILDGKVAFLKKWRDKVIAHNDYEHGVNQELLPRVEIADIDEIIKEMSKLLNILQMNLSTNTVGGYTHYDSVAINRGASMLISYLKRGIREREQELERLRPKKSEPPA